MPKTTPVSYDTKRDILAVWKAEHLSARKLAKQFGLHHKTVGKILDQFSDSLNCDAKEDAAIQAPYTPDSRPELVEASEIKGDRWNISLPKTRIHTLEELLEYCEVDTKLWSVDRFTCNKWEVGAKDSEGKIQVSPLFQVKAFLIKKKDVEAAAKEIEELKEMARLDGAWPVLFAEQQTRPLSGLMLEINIPDLHQGKLAWGVETGGPNYDVKISEATFWRALDTLLARVEGYNFDLVLFVIGNDLLNSDDIEGRTTAGTYVSSDARFHKTFVTTRSMIIRAVQRLKQVAPVKVLPVYGNHDRLSSWHLADSVEMYFTNDPEVEVDNRPRPIKYHQHGKVLLGFCHGDKGKRDDYPMRMATDEPVAFGQTLFREIHTGHTHKTKLDEKYGVRVRVLPALCPADSWHSENGFVNNQRAAEAYVWHKEEGLVSIVFHTET
jgi:hypothetical protein